MKKQFDDIILNVLLFVHSRDARGGDCLESDIDCELIFVRVIVNILDSGDNLVEEVLLDLLKSSDLSIELGRNLNEVSLISVACINCGLELGRCGSDHLTNAL
jgi:hypothetical protein